MQKKFTALAAAAALTAAFASSAAAHDDPCPGASSEPFSASGLGGSALAADRNGDDVICFNDHTFSFKDNHTHSH